MSLENKIPPPVVLLASLLLVWLSTRIDQILLIPGSWRIIIAISLLLVGLITIAAAALRFNRQQTTINPLTPADASKLVTNGVFAYSRNPMYLGMVLILLSAACYFGSLSSLLVVAAFIAFLSRFQIEPEERAMKQLFGKQFEQYRARVGRWF